MLSELKVASYCGFGPVQQILPPLISFTVHDLSCLGSVSCGVIHLICSTVSCIFFIFYWYLVNCRADLVAAAVAARCCLVTLWCVPFLPALILSCSFDFCARCLSEFHVSSRWEKVLNKVVFVGSSELLDPFTKRIIPCIMYQTNPGGRVDFSTVQTR